MHVHSLNWICPSPSLSLSMCACVSEKKREWRKKEFLTKYGVNGMFNSTWTFLDVSRARSAIIAAAAASDAAVNYKFWLRCHMPITLLEYSEDMWRCICFYFHAISPNDGLIHHTQNWQAIQLSRIEFTLYQNMPHGNLLRLNSTQFGTSVSRQWPLWQLPTSTLTQIRRHTKIQFVYKHVFRSMFNVRCSCVT